MLYQTLEKTGMNSTISHCFMVGVLCSTEIKADNNYYYYTSDSLWKIWVVESIQSIHNSLRTQYSAADIAFQRLPGY